MIPAEYFLERFTEFDRWLAARAGGVSATAVALAAVPSSFEEAVSSPAVEPNEYMRFGTESEAELMRHAHREHGILPSDWVIRGQNPNHLATPDGLSLDHRLIAECKTTGKDWSTVPIKYRRQVQWQLHVTGADRCLFVWNLRAEDAEGRFYLGWITPKTLWIERDKNMIADLIEVAEKLQEVRNVRRLEIAA